MIVRIVGIIAATVILLVIAAGVGMYFGFIPNPFISLFLKPPEHSARYYPEDTLAYAWLTLYPEGGQREHMTEVWERFNDFRMFRTWIDELQEDFEDETGVDLKRDVLTWIGPDVSVGFIDVKRDETPVFAATIGVRDKAAAAVFMDQWLDYLEDTEGANFDASDYRGFDTWVDEEAQQAYALSGELLIAATTRAILEEVVDLTEADSGRSLADNETFQVARAALHGDRFGSVYVNIRETVMLVEEFPDEFAYTISEDFEGVPDWAAGSVQWVERGIVTEMVMPNTVNYQLEVAELSNPARLLPADTLGFAAATFDPTLDNWRAELSEYLVADLLPDSDVSNEYYSEIDELGGNFLSQLEANADLANVLDLVIVSVDSFTGINLERDLFDYLGGEAILAVTGFDFEKVERDPIYNPVDVVSMLSYHSDGEEALSNTLDKTAGLIETYSGMDADPSDVGADNLAQVFDLSEFDTSYSPGYVLHDGYLTIATTDDALESIVSVRKGQSENLEANAEYQRAVGHLPGNRQFLAWVDLHGIIAQLDPEDFDIDQGEFRVLEEGIGAVAVSAQADEVYFRSNFALTLFPE